MTTHRFYARLSGFLFLWLIVTGLAGAITVSRIVGSGTIPQIAQRVAASERLYRVALCSELIETMSALLLGYALYIVLKPIDEELARLAMYWRFGESFIGAVGMMFGFVRLRLYLQAAPSEPLIRMTQYAGSAEYNIGALFFSIGSILFYRAFLKSRYLPRGLSMFGIFASVVVTLMCFANMIFPEYGTTLQYGWAPMAIAEVVTGFWLIFGKIE